jgi:hypothetical protein
MLEKLTPWRQRTSPFRLHIGYELESGTDHQGYMKRLSAWGRSGGMAGDRWTLMAVKRE